jgi:hypothetical protein
LTEEGSSVKVKISQDGQMIMTEEGASICLRRMDTSMLESLKEERNDLMKVTTEHLKQVLIENNIPFESRRLSTRVALVDLLLEELNQNQRKVIIARYSNVGVAAP